MKRRKAALTLSLVLGVLLPWNAQAIPLGWIDSDYPYVGFTQLGASFGSGVLIAPDVVLTAAHVAERFAPARANLFVIGDDPFVSAERIVGVTSSVVHPLYDESTVLFDFGLLFLDEPIPLTEYATLWPSEPESLLGMAAEVVGYGGTYRRQAGNASVDDIYDSRLISLPFYGLAVVEPGDSGGGLFVDIDGQNVLAAISSYIWGDWSFFGPVSQARSFIDQYVPDARWYGESVVEPPVSVPEPATLLMLSVGFVVITARRCWIRPADKSRLRIA